MQHRYTEGDNELIRLCWRDGTSINALAKLIGVSHDALWNHAHHLRLGKHPREGYRDGRKPLERDKDGNVPVTLAKVPFIHRRLPGEPETGFWL